MQHVKSATKFMFRVCFGGLHLIQALCVALPLGITDAGLSLGSATLCYTSNLSSLYLLN